MDATIAGLIERVGLPLAMLIAATIILWRFIDRMLIRVFDLYEQRSQQSAEMMAARAAERESVIAEHREQLERCRSRLEAAEDRISSLASELIQARRGSGSSPGSGGTPTR